MDIDLVRYALLPILSPVGLFSFKQACRYFDTIITIKMITNRIMANIDQRLERIFGKNIEIIRNMFKEYGVVVTGSIILQAMLEEEWNYDLDLYVSRSGTNLFELLGGTDDGYWWNDLYTGASYQNLIMNGNNIKIIKHWEYADNTSLFTKLKYDAFSDFDITRNIYTTGAVSAIYIHKPADVFNKIITFQVGKKLDHTIERYEKYINRGFTSREPLTFYNIAAQINRDKQVLDVYTIRRIGQPYFDYMQSGFLCDYEVLAGHLPNLLPFDDKYIGDIKMSLDNGILKILHRGNIYGCSQCPLKIIGTKTKHLHINSETGGRAQYIIFFII